MIRAGVIGATGYVGSELLRLLDAHPEAETAAVASQSYNGRAYGDVFENFRHNETLFLEEENLLQMAETLDVIFLALPHGVAGSKINESILAKTKVIDLGADYRFKNQAVYEKWYGVPHASAHLLEESVYGLCEINREKVKTARLVGNPGCYTTSAILSLYPLLKEGMIEPNSIIVDAKSGVSGAGRGLDIGTHYPETNESIKAYKIAAHRHTPEIEEQLSYAAGQELVLSFTPHLIPMNRGILTTSYATLRGHFTYDRVKEIFTQYYGDEYFIRLTKEGVLPETKWVKASNFCDIGFTVDERTNRIVVIGALDNLIKGAAGQAIQNMNILFGKDEKMGLGAIPAFL